MVSKKKIEFLNSEDEEEKSENIFKINKNYAEKYENWRSKEELQKCNNFLF